MEHNCAYVEAPTGYVPLIQSAGRLLVGRKGIPLEEFRALVMSAQRMAAQTRACALLPS